MTMAFRLGLVGRDMAGTGEVKAWDQQGLDVDAQVEYTLTGRDDALVVIDQLQGLHERVVPLPVVPLELDHEPRRNGFYRVADVAAGLDRRLFRSNRVVARLRLVRVIPSTGLPGEHVLWGADRAATPTSGSWVGFGARPWVAWPASWIAADATDVFGLGNYALTRNVTTDLAVNLLWVIPYEFSLMTEPTPATFYDAACTIRMGNPLNYVVGRAAHDVDWWEISNGLIRITNPSNATAAFDLKYRNAAGSAWSTRTRRAAIWTGGASQTAIPSGCNPSTITITRNTPEAVSVRLSIPVGDPYGLANYDLTLRRGSRYVQISFSASGLLQWVVGHETGFNGAWGGIDSPSVGAIETNPDVNDNRSFILLGSVQVAGVGFVNTGRCYNGGTYASIEAAMGYEAGATLPETHDQAAYVERAYFAAQAETFRVL